MLKAVTFSAALLVATSPALAATVSPAGTIERFDPAASTSFPVTGSARLEYTTIDIGAGITVSASPADFPDGLELVASGDIHIFGLLDASGVDLSISTAGTFHLHEGGGFLANDFTVDAGVVVMDGEFQAVEGGYLLTSPGSGGTSFSGSGFVLRSVGQAPQVASYELYEDYFALLNLVPVPIPAAWLLMVTALGGLLAWSRSR